MGKNKDLHADCCKQEETELSSSKDVWTTHHYKVVGRTEQLYLQNGAEMKQLYLSSIPPLSSQEV